MEAVPDSAVDTIVEADDSATPVAVPGPVACTIAEEDGSAMPGNHLGIRPIEYSESYFENRDRK